MKKPVIILAAALLMAAHAAYGGSHREYGGFFKYGYSESRISETGYRVRYNLGKALVIRESLKEMESYVLYRSAELAITHGYRYFTVHCSDLFIDRPRSSFKPNLGSWAYANITFAGEKAPGKNTYEAEQVIEEIGQEYSIPRRVGMPGAGRPVDTPIAGRSRLGCITG